MAEKDQVIQNLSEENHELTTSSKAQISQLDESLTEYKDKCEKLEQILKEVEWTHDQMRKERQTELTQLQHEMDELRRKSDIQEQHVRDEVEKLWRSKVLEKDSALKATLEEIELERRKFKDTLTTKEYEHKSLMSQFNDLKAKLISLQAENDDLSNKLTIGQLDQGSQVEKQRLKIEKLEADLETRETSYKDRIRELTQQLDQVKHENHSKSIELSTLKERSDYEARTTMERYKLDTERLENSYKFQIRKLEDKIRDLEREVERLRFKDDTSNTKILELERKLAQQHDKKDQDWKLKLEAHDREMLDVKHSLQEKSNKLYLLKEKCDTLELNLEAKTIEVKKLRFDIRELEDRNRDLEEDNHSLRMQYGDKVVMKALPENSTKIKQLQERIRELEQQVQNQNSKPVNQSVEKLKKSQKIPFVEQPYTKRSKNSAFDDLNLDDDGLSDDSLFREGSELNETERLKNLRPAKESSAEASKEIEQLRDENTQLKVIISQMKDEMLKIVDNKPEKDSSSGELNFFRSTNKKLISQIDAEKERYEILEKELDIKVRELEIANSSITNLSKRLSQKDKDIEILIDKLKQQKQVITSLKDERDKLLNISNDLRGELNYVRKQGDTRSEACAKDLQDRQLDFSSNTPLKDKNSLKQFEYICLKCQNQENIQTSNREVQVNSIFEIPRIDRDDTEVKSNDRYQYKPEFVVSQNMDFDQNDEINRLHDEINYLRGSMEILKLEQARKTIESFGREKFPESFKENADEIDEDFFNPNNIEQFLKHREEIDQVHQEEPYNYPVYRDSPERDPGRKQHFDEDKEVKARKENYMKKRFAELKGCYETNLDDFVDDSDRSC